MKAFVMKIFRLLFLMFLSHSASVSAQPSCATGTFYGWSTNGFIYEMQLSGGVITLNPLSVTTGTRYGLGLADFGGGYKFYSAGSLSTGFTYDVLSYDGINWTQELSNPNSLHNCGGHGSFLYYQYIGTANQTGSARFSFISRYNGSSLQVVYSDTTVFMRVADIAVDNSGNVYFFSDSVLAGSHVSRLNIISPSGNVLARIPVSFDGTNAYGSFLEGSTLYVGLGPGNSVHPNTLLPFTISGTTATQGTPIPVPRPIIGGTVGNPTFLNFSDLASCASAKVNFTDITSLTETDRASFAISLNAEMTELRVVTDRFGQNQSITITDAQGRIVLSKKVDSENEIADVSMFPAGLYVVRLADGDRIYSKKFIKAL